MTKTTLTEDARADFRSFFDDETFTGQPIAVSAETSAAQTAAANSDAALDAIVTFIKYVFLYLPGAVGISMVGFGFVLISVSDGVFIELFAGMLGALAVGAFMIMFGIGKLLDLRYLKVVLSVLLVSSAAAFLIAGLEVFLSEDLLESVFGALLAADVAVSAAAGYLVKRNIDNEADNL